MLRDIVTSNLPGWTNTRAWILARPIAGFATTFAQLHRRGRARRRQRRPEEEDGVEGVVFVMSGALSLQLEGGATCSSPEGTPMFRPVRTGGQQRRKHARKLPVGAQGVRTMDGPAPESFVTRDQDVEPVPMPDTDGAWATTRFVDPDDLAHDMHVNIVTFKPGGVIPFAETHVMEHGLYVLEGKAVYRLNGDWVEARRATSCGCARFARRPATRAGRARSATCSTRT